MNLIQERDKRTIYRKLRKKQYDELITLAADDIVGRFRLLDEGAIVDAAGNIDFYIKKGTLSKFYEDLPEDYEGAVKFAHHPLAQFPILLGTWTKRDLHLVDIGGGRHGLDVDLRLDKELNLVQDLMRMPFTIGISAEIRRHFDMDASKRLNVPVTDGITLSDFGIVGEAGNVNSSNINLQKGGTALNLKELSAALENEQNKVTDLAGINDLIEKTLAAEEVEETEAEETEVEETEEAEETVEEKGEEKVEDVEESAEETAEEPEEKEDDGVNLAAVMTIIDDLRKDNESLRQQLDAVTKKLSVKEKAEKEFVEKFKNLSVSLSSERKPVVEAEAEVVFTDGIGE